MQPVEEFCVPLVHPRDCLLCLGVVPTSEEPVDEGVVTVRGPVAGVSTDNASDAVQGFGQVGITSWHVLVLCVAPGTGWHAHGVPQEELSRMGFPGGFLGQAQTRRELIFAVTVGVTIVAAPDTTRRVLVAVILTLALGLYALLVRGPERTAPVALVLCSAGGLAAMLLAPSGVAEWPVLLAAVHTRTVFKDDAGLWVMGVLAVVFGGLVGLISHSLVGVIAGIGVPVLAQRRIEQLELEAERDRAVRLLAELEAARDAQAQAAALQERGRIAREMHDVLAHSLAGLSLQLQATRAVAAREGVGPEVMEPLDRAAELARSGVEEAKAVVGALGSSVRASVGIDDVTELVERFPGDAQLTVAGAPQAVSEAAGHAVYRAVQESLTNAARYAPGAAVRVTMSWEPAQLRLIVSDTGSLDAPPPASQGNGLGLRGMQERVASVGGTLLTGPRGAGWQTEIVVPVNQS
jgi:signal transduction histidine kinase